MKLLGQPGRTSQTLQPEFGARSGTCSGSRSPSVHACVCSTHELLGRVTSEEPTGGDHRRPRRVTLSGRARRPGRGQRESSFARNFLHSRSSSEKRQQFQNGVSGFRLGPTLTLSCTHLRKAHRLQSSLPILTGQGHRDD